MAASSVLALQRDGGIARIVLDNDAKRNALDWETADAFFSAIATAAEDPSVAVVVLSSSGEAFCAGGDLTMIRGWAEGEPAAVTEEVRLFYRKFLAIRRLPMPVIAAVKGAALGAGLALMTAADLIVVARDARLGANFVNLGIHPGMGSTALLSHGVHRQAAFDLLLTGREFSGEEAQRLGLAARCVAADEVDAVAAELAITIARQPRVARLLKRTIYLGERLSPDDALEIEALAQGLTMTSADVRQRLGAPKQSAAQI